MSENLATLPCWKKNATVYERLSELALEARTRPERFERFVIVYQGKEPNGNWKIRIMDHNADLAQSLGLLDLGMERVRKASER